MLKKRIKNKAIRIILYLLIGILSIFILIFLILYLAVPTYNFDEPKPFSGEILHNPYQNMNPDNWKKYNFHAHSRQYGGLTNGRYSTPENIEKVYKAMGYDHYGISDYMHINTYGSTEDGYIPTYEHGYGLLRKTHQLCIGAEKVNLIDYPFTQNLNIKQHNINSLAKNCKFPVIAHPVYTKGYKLDDMKYLSNYRLMEVMSPFGNSLEYWDMALSNGHRVYAICNDDSHNVDNPNEVGRNFTMINTPDLNPENVYKALGEGNAYGVDFHIYYNKPFELKVNQMKHLPYLTEAKLQGDTLIVKTSAHIEYAEFIGQDGKVLKTMKNVDSAFYVIQPEDTYVRTILHLPKLTKFYLNPITRQQSEITVDKRLDSVNHIRTWLTRGIFIIAIILLIRTIIVKPKDENQNNEIQ
jgi:hypothetical protein